MESSRPFFSIITAAYKAEDTIQATIDSVDDQLCHDWEHIIQVGESPDNTFSIANKANKTGRKCFNEADQGIYDAMNKGLKKASGKYVFFLNADDTFRSPTTLKDIKEVLEKGGLPEYYTAAVVKEYKNPDYELVIDRPLSADRLAKGQPPPHQATFTRKELFEQLGPFDLKYVSAGDFDWHCRALRADVNYLHDPKTIVCTFATGGYSSAKVVGRIETRKIIRAYFGIRASLYYAIEHIYLGFYLRRFLQLIGLDSVHGQLLKLKQTKLK